MGDDALFRRLYPEWTGDTGPLITWLMSVIILILIPFLFYAIQEHFSQYRVEFYPHRNSIKTRQLKISDFLVLDKK